MQETSTLTDLAKKLKEKNERDLAQIEKIERDALESLSRKLRQSLQQEVTTIESDIKRKLTEIKKELEVVTAQSKEISFSTNIKITLLSLLIGILIGIGISVAVAVKRSFTVDQGDKVVLYLKLLEKGK